MPNQVTNTGIQTATQAELYAQFLAAYQTIYGADINLESDTPDGQMLNIFIQAILDLEDLVVQVFNSFDPDLAIGTVLDQRCAINGIQRQGGTYTTTNITVTTSQSVNLYGLDQSTNPVYTVSDNAGNQWQLITSVTGLPIGDNVLLFRAANPGQVLTIPNTINIPVTIVLGVTAVNNPTLYSTLGINEETDQALRVRRQQSVSIASRGYLQSLLAALNNINGISAFVHENDSSGTDGNGIPGHSIWVIISGTPSLPLALAFNSLTTYVYGQVASEGGVNYISIQNNNTGNDPASSPTFWEVYNPIAYAIYNYRNAGCGMKGSISYNITQVDGSIFTIYWDMVNEVQPFIKIEAGSLNKVNPPNVAGIISYLAANYVPGVAAELNVNQVSTLVQQADSNSLALFPTGYGFADTAGGSYTFTKSVAALNDQFQIASSKIIVLPIIMTCTNGVITFDSNGLMTGLTISVAALGTITFNAVGGYGTLTWVASGVGGGGSVSPSTGPMTVFTAGTVNDTVTVTDSLGNTQTATITVI